MEGDGRKLPDQQVHPSHRPPPEIKCKFDFLVFVSQRRLASGRVDARQLSNEGNTNIDLTPHCGEASRLSKRPVSPSQRRLPPKKRKLPGAEETPLGFADNEWIDDHPGSSTPSKPSPLIGELLLRSSGSSVLLHPAQQLLDVDQRYPAPPSVKQPGDDGNEVVGHLKRPSFSGQSPSHSILGTALGKVTGTFELPPSSASHTVELEESAISEGPGIKGVPGDGAHHRCHFQQASSNVSGPSNPQLDLSTLLSGSARHSAPHPSSAFHQGKSQQERVWSFPVGQWTQKVFPQGRGSPLPPHEGSPPEARTPNRLNPVSKAFQTSQFGASEQRGSPFINLLGREGTRNPGPSSLSFPQRSSARPQMQHAFRHLQNPPEVHAETSVGASGGQLETECQTQMGSDVAASPEFGTSSGGEHPHEAAAARAVLSAQRMTKGSSSVSAWLPLELPFTTPPPHADLEFAFHLFFRLPLLNPQRVLRPFCATAAFSLKHVPSDPIPLLEQARRFLTLDVITPEALEKLTEVGEMLVSHAIVHQTKPLTHFTDVRAVGSLGLRFMILDAVLCIVTLTGEQLPNLWFENFASLIPDDAPPRPQGVLGDERKRFHGELLQGLSRAMRILKTGIRPSARDVVMLKQMLFCSPLTHRSFRTASFDGWRADNARAQPVDGGESVQGEL
ncbi:hypothetical protein, conserved [Eimeria praecox]|uniref:Uncharacterized protein n=1 Tax=Eimeria praecox TaxID=51316 RepID=U6GYV0_9EIME|nr:hypothetical protein, conserved [Eimeria praecox]